MTEDRVAMNNEKPSAVKCPCGVWTDPKYPTCWHCDKPIEAKP